MRTEEIEKLLTLFYDGKTDEREEELLYEALSSTKDLSPRLNAEKSLFLAMYHPAQTYSDNYVPAELEDRLNTLIDRKARESQPFYLRYRRWIGGVVAAVLTGICIGLGVNEMTKEMFPPLPQDTYSNPEDAYQALQSILSEVSANWQEGIEQIEATQADIISINHEIKNELKR